jgi:predicted component of type VI protein secretion system
VIQRLNVMMMSGVEDGGMLECDVQRGDGKHSDKGVWVLTIGRREENDICLKNDTYISRFHARLIHYHDGWVLEDLDSTNGSFLEDAHDFFHDIPVKGAVRIAEGQLFRVGRTWLTIEAID